MRVTVAIDGTAKRFRPMKRALCFLLPLTLAGLCGPAMADSGLPMLAIAWPVMFLGFIPIVGIEAVVIRRSLGVPWKHAAGASAIANLISTVAGIPITWILLLGLQIAFELAFPGAESQRVLGSLLMLTQIAWMPPPAPDTMWTIPTVFLGLLVPFLIASRQIEYRLGKNYFPTTDKKTVRAAFLRANVCSYALLALFCVVWLVSELRSS